MQYFVLAGFPEEIKLLALRRDTWKPNKCINEDKMDRPGFIRFTNFVLLKYAVKLKSLLVRIIKASRQLFRYIVYDDKMTYLLFHF